MDVQQQRKAKDRIAGRFQSEFTAVTDVELQPEHNERHRFVGTRCAMRHRVFAHECFRPMGAEAESTDAVTKSKDRRGRLSYLIADL